MGLDAWIEKTTQVSKGKQDAKGRTEYRVLNEKIWEGRNNWFLHSFLDSRDRGVVLKLDWDEHMTPLYEACKKAVAFLKKRKEENPDASRFGKEDFEKLQELMGGDVGEMLYYEPHCSFHILDEFRKYIEMYEKERALSKAGKQRVLHYLYNYWA